METLMKDGEWMIRRGSSGGEAEVWVSHTACFKRPRKVRKGRCHSCGTEAPATILAFLDLVKWER